MTLSIKKIPGTYSLTEVLCCHFIIHPMDAVVACTTERCKLDTDQKYETSVDDTAPE